MKSTGSGDSQPQPRVPNARVSSARMPAQPRVPAQPNPRVPAQPRTSSLPAARGSKATARPGTSGRPATPTGRKASRPRKKVKETGRAGRTSNRNTVVAPSGSGGSLSFGGLTISFKTIAALVIVAMVAVVLLPVSFQLADEQREYRESSAQLREAKDRYEELTRDLENWENRDFVAAQARTRLGYVEKGETQFSVSDVAPNDQNESEVASTQREGPAKPWMMKMQQLLQDLDAGNS